ncbi:hypothetical protein [Rubrivirga sp.]|uniref:hypothetical protein n=1 Tax=Rubrivirga sp. TaxID=1885344 RepID=UPI003B5270D0
MPTHLTVMAAYHFWIRLTFGTDNLGASAIGADEFLDAIETPLFEAFQGDVSPSFRDGHGMLECDLEAPDFDSALRSVVEVVMDAKVETHALPLRELVFEDA